MKAIMVTVRLWWFYLTYKGIKVAEIRKRFAKNFKGKIYEYVSKTNWKKDLMKIPEEEREFFKQSIGKVGLCFECDKVEEIRPSTTDNFTKDSCLTIQELENYLWSNILFGYAIHITNLEIFDKPKELKEFYKVGYKEEWHNLLECAEKYKGVFGGKDFDQIDHKYRLTRAPQSWCYVEI